MNIFHSLAVMLLLAVSSTAFAADRPNFILLITDDISQEDFGCYGNTAAKTPNLDQMASEGIRFTNAYLTCSSCSPSRCSLITGRYPHNTGACELHTELPAGHFLFPKALRDSGYYTALSGKHHMGENVNHAFDIVSKGKGPGKEEDWVAILKERPSDQPFFFWFASSDAHRNWTINDDAPKFDPATIKVPPYLIDSKTTREDLASYYHEVSRSDTYVGKLRDELDSQGIAGDTYFIFMSDNGRPFPRCKTIVVLCLATPLARAEQASQSQQVDQATELGALLDRVWEYEITQSPLLATNIGDKRFQDRLADVSLAAIKERTDQRREFLSELQSIDIDSLDDLAQVDHVLLQRRLEQQIGDFEFDTHLMPISKRDGFHIEFPELPRLMNPKTPADFDNYIARLNDFGRYTDQHIALLRGGIRAGLTQPSVIMRESVQQAEAHIVDDPSQSLLLTSINDEIQKKLGKEAWQPIEAKIIDAIRTSVIPAYQRFRTFLQSECLPAVDRLVPRLSLADGSSIAIAFASSRRWILHLSSSTKRGFAKTRAFAKR